MYIGFLKALGCKYLTEIEPWQMADYKVAITGHKTMWHRSRRSGKSLGLGIMAAFFSIIDFGFRANQGKVVWRVPATDQLEQAQSWLRQNPFVMSINHENDVGILMGKPLDMACLSSGKAASKGASVIIEDEYRDVPKGYAIFDIAVRAEDIAAEGPNETRRIISASTGCRLTLFHDHFLSNEWAYCRHTYKECWWITDEYVESKRREHPEDPYFVEQEFMAIWVARGDTIFRNLYIIDMKARTVHHNEVLYKFGDHPFFPIDWEFPKATKAGCDFNDSAGHYVVIGSVDLDAVYLNQEFVVRSIAALKPFGKIYDLEVESGPFAINIENAKKCIKLKVRCLYRNWDKYIIAIRFRLFMDRMIIIDRAKASFTLGNFLEAVSDENSRESKIKKNSKQHGLDAAFHMAHRKVEWK